MMKTENDMTITGNVGGNIVQKNKTTNKKSSKIAIGVIVIVVGIVAVIGAARLFGGNNENSLAKTLVGDWGQDGKILVSFYKDGTMQDFSQNYTARFMIRSDKALVLTFTGWTALLQENSILKWDSVEESNCWYVSGNRLIFGGNALKRIK